MDSSSSCRDTMVAFNQKRKKKERDTMVVRIAILLDI